MQSTLSKYLLYILFLLTSTAIFSQEVLIDTNIQDWTAQSTSGSYTQNITVQGVTKVIKMTDCSVTPTQSAPGAGTSGECSKGRIVCASNKGVVELPELKDIGLIRINATTGSNDRSFALEKKNGSNWDLLESFTTQNTCGQFTYTLNASGAITLRMRSNTGSSLYIWDIYVESKPDQGPPQIVSLSPQNEQTGISVNPVFRFTFNKNIQKGTGNISIFNTENTSVPFVQVTSGDIDIEDKTAEFQLQNALAINTTYYILIPATLFKDVSDTYFPGIQSDAVWSFTTRSTLNSAKEILSLKLPGQQGSTRFPSDGKIEIDVKFATADRLVPTEFNLSEAASLVGASVTDEIDISSPVTFIVKAEDGSTKTWTLTVKKLPNTAADITKFEIERGIAVINVSTATVEVTVWGYTSLASLSPFITLSANATCNINLTVPADFTSQKEYIITSEDKSAVKTWKVNVKVLQPAVSPVTYEGPWKTMSRQGWIAYNLGDDDTKTGSDPNGAANIASEGSFVMLYFDLIPEQLDYRFRPTGSSGDNWEGIMQVQVSAGGQYWEVVRTHEELVIPSSTNCAQQIPVTLDDTVRYVRFILTHKPAIGGNAIVDGITVTPKHIRASYYPENNETSVPLDVEPVIIFDTPILKINGVSLPDALSNIKLVQKSNSTEVPSSVSISNENKRVTIKPVSPLTILTSYQIVIEGTVEAVNGIRETFTVAEFRTEASPGDSNKDITSFSVNGQKGSAMIDKPSKTVTVKVLEGTDIKNEIPDIAINGNSYRLIWNFGGSACPQYYEVTANDGTTAEWKIVFIVDDGTDIPFLPSGESQLVIYPNPAHNYFGVKSDVHLRSVRVYNSLGVKLKDIQTDRLEVDVDITGFSSGLYIVTALSADGTLKKGVLIKK